MINFASKSRLLLLHCFVATAFTTSASGDETVTWDPAANRMEFNLSNLSGVLDLSPENPKYSTHHFSKVRHKPSNTLVSPDEGKMKHVGMLNFFRVLIRGGYLTELRAEKPVVTPEKDGVTLTYLPTVRRQAKVIIRFTFREPNIIDMDLSVETLANYPGFEILLSSYQAEGFVSGAYVAKKEFEPSEPEQIRSPEDHRVDRS